jgi:Polysaccharide deacetylase
VEKAICFTVDIEPDFGGLTSQTSYYGVDNLPRLVSIVKRNNVKLTAFITGKTLEDNTGVLDILKDMDAEVEQHSYAHNVGYGQKIDDMEKGIKIHEKFFGTKPAGYRAPEGIITRQDIHALEKFGIKFDSSIFPAFFPGRFRRTNFPITPFRIRNSTLLELPFAVVPRIRIPIGLSYTQLLGFNAYKFLFSAFGLPEIIVYDFHCYELGKMPSFADLPAPLKLGYFRAQCTYKDPSQVLEAFIKYILSKGYKSKYMFDVFTELHPIAQQWDWKEDKDQN